MQSGRRAERYVSLSEGVKGGGANRAGPGQARPDQVRFRVGGMSWKQSGLDNIIV